MNIRCTDFRAWEKGYVKGFACIQFVDIGLEIRDVVLQKQDGKEFITMPSKTFFKDGERSFFHMAIFPDIRDRRNFERLALDAINEFRCRGEGRKHAICGG